MWGNLPCFTTYTASGRSKVYIHVIMEAPAVLVLQIYRELCMAVKNEERRQNGSVKRQQHARTTVQSGYNSVLRV